MRNKIVSFIFCIIILPTIFLPISVFAENEGKVEIFDYAELFSEKEEEEIVNHINSLSYSNYNMDIIVLTADQWTGTIEEYTDNFYDDNGFGKDGILFFINNDEVYINTVGYSIIAINDEEIDKIIDSGWAAFTNYDFINCIKYMTTEAANYIDIAYANGYDDPNIDTDITVQEAPIGDKITKAIVPSFASIFLSAIVAAIVLMVLNIKHDSVSKTESAKKYIGNSFAVNQSNTRFINTYEYVHHNFYRPSNSSTGGHSSGSSHRSSSGRSHGGGGRHR